MISTRMHKRQLQRLLVTDILKSDFSLNRHKQDGSRQLTSAHFRNAQLNNNNNNNNNTRCAVKDNPQNLKPRRSRRRGRVVRLDAVCCNSKI